MEKENLISKYKEASLQHFNGTVTGDYKMGNRAYDEVIKTFELMIERGEDRQFFFLYNDDSLWVQSWAAVHTLELDEKRATEKLLDLIEKDENHVSFCSKYALQEWSKGKLRSRKILE